MVVGRAARVVPVGGGQDGVLAGGRDAGGTNSYVGAKEIRTTSLASFVFSLLRHKAILNMAVLLLILHAKSSPIGGHSRRLGSGKARVQKVN